MSVTLRGLFFLVIDYPRRDDVQWSVVYIAGGHTLISSRVYERVDAHGQTALIRGLHQRYPDLVDDNSYLVKVHWSLCSLEPGVNHAKERYVLAVIEEDLVFFLLAGCNRSLGYRQSRLKRRKETEGPKHQSRSKSSALPLRPERLHSFCVKELGMRHKQQHKPKNTQQKPKPQTTQKHHNNHKREKSHP